MRDVPEPLSPKDVERITAEERLREQIRGTAPSALFEERVRRVGLTALVVASVGLVSMLTLGWLGFFANPLSAPEQACRNSLAEIGELRGTIASSHVSDFAVEVRADVRINGAVATFSCRAERTGDGWITTDLEPVVLR